MKKVYIGGYNACSCHNEKSFIKGCVNYSSKHEITDNIEDADIIIAIDTCVSTYNNFTDSIDCIKEILNKKKKTCEVIVSGCLAKGTKLELTAEQKNVLSQVTCVLPEEVCEYVAKMILVELPEFVSDELVLPVTISKTRIKVTPVSGCLNNCSFCKTNYMNFSLKSVPFEYLEKFAVAVTEVNEQRYALNYARIAASNLSLYGVDLYNEQRAHDAVKVLTSPECIKWAEVGSLINFYPELINEVLNNSKIRSMFISLESGSERIYNLMNRPISLNKLKEIIKLIRRERPDILINTEIICGFPTESFYDLDKSIETLYELDINPMFLHPYFNSHCIPSSKLSQHSIESCVAAVDYAEEKLEKLRQKYIDFVFNGEKLVIGKNNEKRMYILMSIDSAIDYVSFDEYNTEYNVNDKIPECKVRRKIID